jgi:hypothetical protein
MLRREQTGKRWRAAVACAAAYALALQVLFGGLLMGQMSAAAADAGDLFAICTQHAEQAPAQGTGSGDLPAHEAACSLCVVATHAPAVLPAGLAVTGIDWSASALFAPAQHDLVLAFASPTGRFQRGPPVTAALAG